jgi:putative copper export protein|tara:strand:- start:856 stop:1236 length:381 start_codon:yes stop_codon:yes gene_type:complete
MEVILKFIHVVGLSVWLGSMVTWAVFAPKLNKYDPTKNATGVLRISFSKISWSSYVVSLLSGITLYFLNESTTANWYIEVAVLGLAGIVIAFHSFATNISVALRGVFNGVMLLLALIAVYLTTIYI